MPGELHSTLDSFQKMLLIKMLNEDKLIFSIKHFVVDTLGKELFIKSPPFDLKGSFNDSTSMMSIIFVLSPGADPIVYLSNLAKDKEMDTRLKMLSLG